MILNLDETVKKVAIAMLEHRQARNDLKIFSRETIAEEAAAISTAILQLPFQRDVEAIVSATELHGGKAGLEMLLQLRERTKR